MRPIKCFLHHNCLFLLDDAFPLSLNEVKESKEIILNWKATKIQTTINSNRMDQFSDMQQQLIEKKRKVPGTAAAQEFVLFLSSSVFNGTAEKPPKK